MGCQAVPRRQARGTLAVVESTGGADIFGVLILVLAAVMSLAIGVKGLAGSGVQLSRTKVVGGSAGKAISVACVIFGVACAVTAVALLVILVPRMLAR